jgi:hypothetical protein
MSYWKQQTSCRSDPDRKTQKIPRSGPPPFCDTFGANKTPSHPRAIEFHLFTTIFFFNLSYLSHEHTRYTEMGWTATTWSRFMKTDADGSRWRACTVAMTFEWIFQTRQVTIIEQKLIWYIWLLGGRSPRDWYQLFVLEKTWNQMASVCATRHQKRRHLNVPGSIGLLMQLSRYKKKWQRRSSAEHDFLSGHLSQAL